MRAPRLFRFRPSRHELVWAALPVLLVFGLWLTNVLEIPEAQLLDYRFRTRPAFPPSDDIVVIEIDDQSIEECEAMGYAWPWPRDLHARLIDFLTEAGARTIALDILFQQLREPKQDAALRDAIQRSGRVILPVFIRVGADPLARSAAGVIGSHRSFAEVCAGEGHISFQPDADGRLRRVRLFASAAGPEAVVYPAFCLLAAAHYLGVPLIQPDPHQRSREVSWGGERVPVDARGNMLCNFFGDSQSTRFRRVQYIRVLRKEVPAAVFKDKLVLVATSGAGIGEQFYHVPLYSGPMPGIAVHANAAETLLRGVPLGRPRPLTYGLCLLLAGYLFALLTIRLRHENVALSIAWALVAVGYPWFAAQWLFSHRHYWLEFYPLLLVVVGTVLAQLGWRLADAVRIAVRRRAHLDAIAQAGEGVTEREGTTDDFRVALHCALTVSDAPVGALWALEESEQSLRLELVIGLDRRFVAVETAPLEHSFLGDVAASSEPLIISDAAGDNWGDALPLPREFQSLVFLPLRAKRRCMGVLCVAHRLPHGFDDDALQSLRAIALQSGLGLDNARLVHRLQNMFVGTLAALVKALEAKDAYTGGHSDRVTEYALMVARHMGLPADEVERISMAGAVHDVGKIGIPDILLHKPDKLTDEEYLEITRHARITGDILEDLDWLREVGEIAVHHHERWDGSGYPDGLRGNEIPLGAQILAVTDAYDAMTSDRPYRTALPSGKAVGILIESAGTQLSPAIVEAFLEVEEAPWSEAADAVSARPAACPLPQEDDAEAALPGRTQP